MPRTALRPARGGVLGAGPWLLLSCVHHVACASPSAPVSLVSDRHVEVVQPGAAYELTYGSAVDEAPVGTTWTGHFARSPLAPMDRPPFVIKADDFGGTITKAGAAFLELASAQGLVVSPGIVTRLLDTDADEGVATYRALDRAGLELWFHGHTHQDRHPAEFMGRSLAAQESSFAKGVERGRSILGIDFHTFGAPANAIDASTPVALTHFPQFVVWLFGDAKAPALVGTDVVVFPRLLELERHVGTVTTPEAFSAALDALLARPAPTPVTVQAHPLRYGAADLDRAARIFADLRARGAFWFTTPFEAWTWAQDARRVTLTKADASTYVLDARGASFAHRIELGGEDSPPPAAMREIDSVPAMR